MHGISRRQVCPGKEDTIALLSRLGIQYQMPSNVIDSEGDKSVKRNERGRRLLWQLDSAGYDCTLVVKSQNPLLNKMCLLWADQDEVALNEHLI